MSTAVTAKVQLQQKNQWVGSSGLTFVPDYQDGANKEWAASTPALKFEMTVVSAVADLFTPGAKYTVTFAPSED